MIVADTINAAMMMAFGVSRFLIGPCLMARRIVERFCTGGHLCGSRASPCAGERPPRAAGGRGVGKLSDGLRLAAPGRTGGDFCGSAALKMQAAASASLRGCLAGCTGGDFCGSAALKIVERFMPQAAASASESVSESASE